LHSHFLLSAAFFFFNASAGLVQLLSVKHAPKAAFRFDLASSASAKIALIQPWTASFSALQSEAVAA